MDIQKINELEDGLIQDISKMCVSNDYSELQKLRQSAFIKLGNIWLINSRRVKNVNFDN